MLPIDRRSRIIEELERRRTIKVTELSELFDVTEETIRRDLEQLEQEGYLKRIYGGAISVRGTGYEAPVSVREIKNIEQKTRIGRKAVELLNDGDTIILDASTTVLQMSRQLPDMSLTVVTNSILVAQELAKRDKLTVLATGGIIRPNSLSFVGPLAQQSLQRYNVDKLFLSCKGLTLEEGITDSNELEVEVKKAMIRSAREVIVLIDSSKFGRVAFATIASLGEINKVITDDKVPPEFTEGLAKEGVEVVVA